MAQGTVSFVTLTPARHTWIGAIRSPLRTVLWTFFPRLFPSPGSVIHRLMDDHDVPALSVAIAKGGIIVFSQGFGFADLDQREKVTADSLFRIASNSKAITAAAVHVLIERGRLSLSDRVFGEGGVLGTSFGIKPYTNWLVQIEVRHLLEHSAGGWGNDSNDPMFNSPTQNHSELIGTTLDADLLKRPPGVEFIYSNFGYCLLGRLIERKTGQIYEEFVRNSVLKPAGANGIRIGQDTLTGRAPGEVVYRCTGASPYDVPLRRMDSHGGWIASAADYVRFLLAIDKSSAPPDVLSATSVTAMRARSMASGGNDYGHGVATNGTNVWHNGALPGSRSVMWSGTGGDAWCVICTGGGPPGSKSKKKGDALLAALDKMMWRLWDLV